MRSIEPDFAPNTSALVSQGPAQRPDAGGAGVAEVHAHRGAGGLGVAGEDGGGDVLVLALDPLDVGRVGHGVRRPRAGCAAA